MKMNLMDHSDNQYSFEPRPRPGTAERVYFEPGGFWRRLIANIIDVMIVIAIQFPISIGVGFSVSILIATGSSKSAAIVVVLQVLSKILGFVISTVWILWFYTKRGATPGKMLFGLTVVNDKTGLYLTWGQVLLREWVGKFLSAIILFIGFLIIPFRDDRRGLHDLIANTRVLHRTN